MMRKLPKCPKHLQAGRCQCSFGGGEDAPEAAHVAAVEVVGDALLRAEQVVEQAEVEDDDVEREEHLAPRRVAATYLI